MGNTVATLTKTYLPHLPVPQDIRVNNNSDKSKYLVYGGLATGIATSAWNLLRADNEPFSLFGMIKRWSIPVVSFAASVLPVISKLKLSGLSNKSYDLKNVDDMKRVFNKIVWNLVESNQDYFKKVSNNLLTPFTTTNLLKAVIEDVIVPKNDQLGLDLEYDKELNILYIQTQPQMCIKKGLHLYGIRINLYNPELAVNLSDKLKIDFISKEIDKINSSFIVENSINSSINELILEHWVKHIPGEMYEDVLNDNALQYVEPKVFETEDGSPVLFIYNPQNLQPTKGIVKQRIREDDSTDIREGA